MNEVKETLWFSVETPSVFCEMELPADEADWTQSDERKYRHLERLAERHGTHIICTSYERG